MKIIVKSHNIECEIKENETLLNALQNDGRVFLDAACNGSGKCGKCKVLLLSGDVNEPTLTERGLLSDKELSDGIRLACCVKAIPCEEDIIITVPDRKKNTVVLNEVGEIRSGEKPLFSSDGEKNLSVAVDIGTTTVAAVLIDIDKKQVIAKASDVNAQVSHGGDVLTRIAYTMTNENGLSELQKLIVDELNELISMMLLETGNSSDKLSGVVVAANCTMLHLLLGVDPSGIGKAPYKPAFTSGQMLKCPDIGLVPGSDALLYALPSVSAFIGADITAGIYMSGIAETDKNVLFIDIGTNGEIVLSKSGKLYACSCAVGPALEGMNIKCGMRAAEGAIESVKFENGQLIIKTIGNVEPVGICGSGVLEIMRMLLETKAVEPSGKLSPVGSCIEDRYYTADKEKGYLICDEGRRIVFTLKDIRQIQLAKGAILSGFTAITEYAGLNFEELDEVVIAGQFGAHLDAETLIKTGILPKEARGKVRYIGNSSLSGACSAALDGELSDRLENIAGDVDYFELATMEGYSKLLMKCLDF